VHDGLGNDHAAFADGRLRARQQQQRTCLHAHALDERVRAVHGGSACADLLLHEDNLAWRDAACFR
jgi:hypothetical protein